jgi:pyruvate formate lyase activating enzyme
METANGGSHEKGVVFNIQRFSLHDGPGIRSTVFLKGCPLRCLWCSNPESQDVAPNLMVRDILCKGCGACAEVCPRGAIEMRETGGRAIDRGLCDGCLLCVDACIYGSLRACGATMAFGDVVREVLRDEAFYRNSNGGVTLSGGEPLLQADFAARLLKEFKEKGLHTAVDTSGYVPASRFDMILPYIDVVLFDIKHLDPDPHLRATGVDNGLILGNLERISGKVAIWLRLPLIPGFNDGEEHIRRVAALGKKIGAEKISLLPYHEGGKSKCEQMGRAYPLSSGLLLSDERVRDLKALVERCGLAASVGS